VIKLNSNELRVIGSMIEKSLTTPDHYPLSLNALTNACNQKSNREPVLSLSEIEVQNTLDSLAEKKLTLTQGGASSRVTKYKHRFCNTEFGDLRFTEQELGIICVLFLRGPQTPGELRTRTNRLCQFNDSHETETVLNKMTTAEKEPLVIRMAREPGKRESRYAHCFSQEGIEVDNVVQDCLSGETNSANYKVEKNQSERICQLEEKVELMQMEIDELRQKLVELLS